MAWREEMSKMLRRRGRISWGGFLLGTAAVIAFSPWARRQLRKAAVAAAVGALNLYDQAHKWKQQAMSKTQSAAQGGGEDQTPPPAGGGREEPWKPADDCNAGPSVQPAEE
ncbi:hypothetical protein [Gelria sp. Kuro-4]|uniref:hypothetical protein n=1 Tax=Gelria sp. Kuro-4 TaxID=2796927 RepID=UPI001BF094D5|nr:hypothetical protein [Gelria sp. Kuro-4]BCV23665.1 hypothetical protein kuro4_04380 [Gelria sp. Kuro-4]